MAAAQTIDTTFIGKSSAKSISYFGAQMIIHLDSHDTNGALALVEVNSHPGLEPPLHVHEREDEAFYILEGKVTITCGNEQKTLLPGETAFLPRTIPHTFRIDSESARALVWITPAGFEEYFRSVAKLGSAGPQPAGPDVQKMIRIAGQLGVRFLSR
jgi:quercetin dioxygenase-like cupin family protein